MISLNNASDMPQLGQLRASLLLMTSNGSLIGFSIPWSPSLNLLLPKFLNGNFAFTVESFYGFSVWYGLDCVWDFSDFEGLFWKFCLKKYKDIIINYLCSAWDQTPALHWREAHYKIWSFCLLKWVLAMTFMGILFYYFSLLEHKV